MSLKPGELVEGKYRIVRLIGEGGMGAVYEGENVRINRRVAIKVLHAAFAGNADVVKRFEREAQAAGRIGNDHILEVLDLGDLPNGDFFMVMEFLEGEELGKRIKARGRMTPRELAPIARQALTGLAAAHAAGIIHRDLKPDNIFLLREKAGTTDFVKIIDFGISKFQPLNNEMKMTQTGAVMGTPYYMSPEQAHGSAEVDARSDLYAFGVILYESVTGSVPFDASTFNQLLFKIVLSEPAPVLQLAPELDPAFATLIEKAMARDTGQRFQSAREFAAAVAAWEQHGTGVAVPPRAPAASLPEITGAGGAGLAASQSAPGTPVFAAGVQTSGNWAASQASVPIRRSKAPLFVALGLGAAVVIGGGAFAASRLGGPATERASGAPALPAAVPAAVSVRPEASASASPLESAAPAASASAAAPASATPAPPAAAPATPKRPAQHPRPALHRTATKAQPKPARPSEPPAPKATGTTPDFGY
jgi:serine/threonine-protein kinase